MISIWNGSDVLTFISQHSCQSVSFATREIKCLCQAMAPYCVHIWMQVRWAYELIIIFLSRHCVLVQMNQNGFRFVYHRCIFYLRALWKTCAFKWECVSFALNFDSRSERTYTKRCNLFSLYCTLNVSFIYIYPKHMCILIHTLPWTGNHLSDGRCILFIYIWMKRRYSQECYGAWSAASATLTQNESSASECAWGRKELWLLMENPFFTHSLTHCFYCRLRVTVPHIFYKLWSTLNK